MATSRRFGEGSRRLAGQGVRFAVAGGVVAGVYLASTTVLAELAGVPFELALVTGFVLGLCAHFTLQRLFVWKDERGFALRFHHQVLRYLIVAGVQYGLTAASTAILPDTLHVATELVYLGTVAVLTLTNFVVFRTRVFHPAEAAPARDEGS